MSEKSESRAQPCLSTLVFLLQFCIVVQAVWRTAKLSRPGGDELLSPLPGAVLDGPDVAGQSALSALQQLRVDHQLAQLPAELGQLLRLRLLLFARRATSWQQQRRLLPQRPPGGLNVSHHRLQQAGNLRHGNVSRGQQRAAGRSATAAGAVLIFLRDPGLWRQASL